MSWSRCAKFRNGATPASCLRGPFLVSRFWCVPGSIRSQGEPEQVVRCGGSALCAQRSPQRCRSGATGSFAAIRESVSRNVVPDLIKRYRRSCALADPTRCDRHLVPLQCLDGRLDHIDLPFRHHLVGHDRLPFGCSCHPWRELVQSRASGRSPSLGRIAAALLPDLTSILTVIEADGPGKPPARTMSGPRFGRSRISGPS
jgi:hypothetical protein